MMTKKQRGIWRFGALAVVGLASFSLIACSNSAGPANPSGEQPADDFPDKPIQVIVPWAAGGGTDVITRQLMTMSEETCDTRFVVQNLTGAASATGHQALVDADPDGYTIATATTELAILKHLGTAAFTPEDVKGIVQIAANPAVLTVSADSPYQTFDDVKDALAQGDTVRAATNGRGGTWDLAVRGLGQALDTHFTEYVPFNGAAEMIPAVLGGQVEVLAPSAGEVRQQIESGAMRGLAVMAEERFPALPDVPTLKELGVDWVMGSWIGVVVPDATPDNRVEKLRDCIGGVAQSAEYIDFLEKTGIGIADRDGAQFTDFTRSEFDRFEKLISEVY